MEEGAPDSFADIDAKLKALEDKTKAELSKLQSDTAAPSSFVEKGEPESFPFDPRPIKEEGRQASEESSLLLYKLSCRGPSA